MSSQTPGPSETKRITLYFRQGPSDKVYTAAIEPSGGGFVVTFAFGRRGSTLQMGVKTAAPVPFEKAKQIFDKLVGEKAAKGYTPGENGTPYQHTKKADRATGIVPQLLNPIEDCKVQTYIASADWWAQEKFDGRRVLIRRDGDTVIGINRQGLTINLPEPIFAQGRTLGDQRWLIDGEAVGDVLFAFDLLESAGADLRAQPYRRRLAALAKIVGTAPAPIRTVETATTTAEKTAMLDLLKDRNAEGIVFKRHTQTSTPGRSASGGDWLKFKFHATASCIVASVNGEKRSVALELLDTRRVGVGNVTIPPNATIPEPGTVVEVHYLYAYPAGSLYQPVYLGVREDLTHDDCRLDQLKLKLLVGKRDLG
jgi:bifunctional non-homologous end joining protein LigD